MGFLNGYVSCEANAMNASATIFEALADIDSKFTKYADKEYERISTEVKKWFKKLSVSFCSNLRLVVNVARPCTQKEEKAHDERLSSANARIKQAGVPLPLPIWKINLNELKGQLYEKKSKKNARDVDDEH